jgi:signal transduction histidine kinase
MSHPIDIRASISGACAPPWLSLVPRVALLAAILLIVVLAAGQPLVAGVVASILAAGFAGAAVTRARSHRSLARIATVLQRLAAGDFEARVGILPPTAPRDVATLGAAADAMAASIGRRKQELSEMTTRAQLASRGKSEFLANMSHELRTPLNAIIGFTELMQHEVYGPLANDKYRTCAGDIRESGEHLLRMINQILDLAKAESGRMKVHYDPVSLADVVQQSVRMLRPRADVKSIVIEVDAPHELPAIDGDELKLRQVMINLIANAVKFTPPGGVVSVSAAIDGDHAWLRVRDTGIGIAEADIARVFEPFRQADNPLGRHTEGTGLGLPLSSKLVEIMGGRLTLSSALGMGTKVEICVPRGRPAASGARKAA